MTTFLTTLPTESGFAAGAVVGDLVFAETDALDAATGRRVPEARTIAEETRVCLDRLAAVLAEAGSSLADLAKVNCYVATNDDRAEFWATWDAIFADIDASPVRITQHGGVAGEARVLLDAVARKR
jgi:2-iminobutanoate/2-iminopropanoate deaminase